MIIQNRRREMGKKSLPYDAEIEYIECNGTQWIDTGITPQGWYPDFELKYEKTNTNGIVTLYTTALSWAWSTETIASNVNDLYFMADTTHTYKTMTKDSVYVLKFIGRNFQLYKDGILDFEKSNVSQKSQPSSIKFFGNFNTHYGKIFYIKIWNNNVLCFDAIPVRVGQVGYMYDKVSGTLFGNAGSGNFIIGNDV